MSKVVGESLRYRYLAVAFAVAVVAFGLASLRTMPLDALPEFQPTFVEVQTEALGLSAEEIESLVTLPLEDLLNGTARVRTIRSQSVTGLSSIVLVFEPGTDIMRARQLVQERLAVAYALPNVAKPPVMLQPVSATNRALVIGLSSEELSLIDLSVLTRWTIKPKLMGVAGVANVAIWGERRRQLQVRLDPERARGLNVSEEQVLRAAGNALYVSPLSFLRASTPGSGGWIDTPNQRLEVQHILPISAPEELARVPIENAGAANTVTLGDVAEIVEEHPPLIGDAIIGGGPGLMLVVEKFPGASTVDVTRGVEAALESLRPGLPGVKFETTVFRPATYIEKAVGNLAWVVGLGALLIAAALIAFFWNVRATLLALTMIVVPAVAALLVLQLRGETVNTMVVAGLVAVLPLLIGNAVGYAAAILRALRQQPENREGRSAADLVHAATRDFRRPLLYATIITLAALSPIFVVEGPWGALFAPLAMTFAMGLLASTAAVLLIAPALAIVLFGGGPMPGPPSRLALSIHGLYASATARIARRPAFVVAGAAALAVAAVAAWPSVETNLLPQLEERDLVVRWATPPGTSHPEMYRITADVSREMLGIPGVRHVAAHIGRAVTGDQIVGINSGSLWISMHSAAPFESTVRAIRDLAASYPGIDQAVARYLGEKVGTALTGTNEDLVVRIYGPELETLRERAEAVRSAIAGVDGLTDVRVENQVRQPQIEIKLDLGAAGEVGLKPGDIRRAAATVFSGLEVGNLFEEQKVFDVVVWSPPEFRSSLTSLRELSIPTPDGGQVQLQDVADVGINSTPTVLRREAISPYIDVTGSIARHLASGVADEVERRLATVDFPLEYHPELLGQSAEDAATETRVLAASATSALAILLLLQAFFGSWRLAALLFLALPAAAAGGVLAAFLSGTMVSTMSYLGLLATFGLAAGGGLALLERCRDLEAGGEGFGPGLVNVAASESFAPVVVTALATALAIVPMVLLGRIPGLEASYEVSIVVLGGLLTSTAIVLLATPALNLLSRRGRPAPA